MKSTRWMVGAAMVALVLLLALGLMVQGPAPATAAPAAAPTPVASVIAAPAAGVPLVFLQNTVLTADDNSAALSVLDFDKVDLQLVVDHSTNNTTTFTLQFSNDNINWVDGAVFGSAVAADANTLNQYAVFGEYARVNTNMTSAAPMTVTVIGVGK